MFFKICFNELIKNDTNEKNKRFWIKTYYKIKVLKKFMILFKDMPILRLINISCLDSEWIEKIKTLYKSKYKKLSKKIIF